MEIKINDYMNTFLVKAKQDFMHSRYISKYAYPASILIITLLAALVRLKNYDLPPLWNDEAWRANVILDPDVYKKLFSGTTFGAITSIGYIAIVKCIAIFHAGEAALRMSSLIPSIATIPLIVTIVRMMSGYRTIGLIAGIAFAFNSDLVSYARELKPYSLELFIHLVSILLTIIYVRGDINQESRRQLYVVLVWWLISILTATNFVFLLPGSVLYVLIHQYKNNARESLIITSSAAIFIGFVALAQYVWIWSAAPKDEGLITYWSNNFYRSGEQPYLSWIVDHVVATAEASHVPVMVVEAHNKLFAILLFVGCVACFIKEPVERILLLISPLVLMAILNILMIWPIGHIRVNIFSYGYMVIITMLGLALFARFLFLRWAVLVIALIIATFSLQLGSKAYSKRRVPFQEVPSMLVSLKEEIGDCPSDGTITVVQNAAVSRAMQYYLNYHPELSRNLHSYFTDCIEIISLPEAYLDPEQVTQELAMYFGENDEMWFVYSHIKDDAVRKLADIVEIYADISREHSFKQAGFFKATRKD